MYAYMCTYTYMYIHVYIYIYIHNTIIRMSCISIGIIIMTITSIGLRPNRHDDVDEHGHADDDHVPDQYSNSIV